MKSDSRSWRPLWWALAGALLLPFAGVTLGKAITWWPAGAILTTALITLGGVLVGLALSRLSLSTAILAAALVQQGLMASILFATSSNPNVDGSVETYLEFPWLLSVELVYAVMFILPGLLARFGLHRATRSQVSDRSN